MAIDSLFITGMPEKLIGGKAYDSDDLDENILKKHGVEIICRAQARQKKASNSGRTEAEAV
jgi:hypothetical protein